MAAEPKEFCAFEPLRAGDRALGLGCGSLRLRAKVRGRIFNPKNGTQTYFGTPVFLELGTQLHNKTSNVLGTRPPHIGTREEVGFSRLETG